MIITAVEGNLAIDRTALASELATAFGADNVTVVDSSAMALSAADYDINVHPEGAPPFTVSQLTDGPLTIDGTEEQDAAVGAIVSGLVPESAGRVVALRSDGGVYVDLTTGITAEQIVGGWRDVSEGGF